MADPTDETPRGKSRRRRSFIFSPSRRRSFIFGTSNKTLNTPGKEPAVPLVDDPYAVTNVKEPSMETYAIMNGTPPGLSTVAEERSGATSTSPNDASLNAVSESSPDASREGGSPMTIGSGGSGDIDMGGAGSVPGLPNSNVRVDDAASDVIETSLPDDREGAPSPGPPSAGPELRSPNEWAVPRGAASSGDDAPDTAGSMMISPEGKCNHAVMDAASGGDSPRLNFASLKEFVVSEVDAAMADKMADKDRQLADQGKQIADLKAQLAAERNSQQIAVERNSQQFVELSAQLAKLQQSVRSLDILRKRCNDQGQDLSRVNSYLTSTNNLVASLQQRIASVGGSTGGVEGQGDETLEGLRREVAELRAQLVTQGAQLDAQGARLDEHGETIREHGGAIEGVETDLDAHGAMLNAQGARLDEHGETIHEHGGAIQGVETQLVAQGVRLDEQGAQLNDMRSVLKALDDAVRGPNGRLAIAEDDLARLKATMEEFVGTALSQKELKAVTEEVWELGEVVLELADRMHSAEGDLKQLTDWATKQVLSKDRNPFKATSVIARLAATRLGRKVVPSDVGDLMRGPQGPPDENLKAVIIKVFTWGYNPLDNTFGDVPPVFEPRATFIGTVALPALGFEPRDRHWVGNLLKKLKRDSEIPCGRTRFNEKGEMRLYYRNTGVDIVRLPENVE